MILLKISKSCQLLGGSFANLLQLFIGLTAGVSLIYKRYVVETNRRPIEIWFLDISKQGISSLIIHFWNIGQSILFSKLNFNHEINYHTDECANYFIYFVLDTFLGVYLVWIILEIIKYIAKHRNWKSLSYQGFYGSPLKMSWYVNQLIIFLCATIISKFILGLFIYKFENTANYITSILFAPFQSRPTSELIFVMVVCPCFLNIVQV